MRKSSLLRSYACITSLFSSASAISVTFGPPTQCDPFSVSWTGGVSPFTIQITPIFHPLYSFPVPPSAFSNGQGSYSIPQLPLASGTEFLLTVLDSTGYSPAAITTTTQTVGPPVANNNCNVTGSQEFVFDTSGTPQQCGEYTFSAYGNAVTPLTIVGLIPGGNLVAISATSTSYTWPVDVQGGTDIVFFVMDSDGEQGGVSQLYTVQPSSNTECLSANSLSSTASAPSQTSSSSTSSQSQSGNSTSRVGIIAGVAGGGGAILLILLIALCVCCRRKASPSPDVTFSPKSEPRRLQRKGEGREVIQDNQAMQNVAPQSTDRISRSLQTQPGSRSQSRLSSASSVDPIRQHIRQISYMDSFPEDFAVNDAHPAFSRPSRLSGDVDATAEHGDAGSSSLPSASRRIVEMARQAASQDYPYETRPVSHHAPPMQHGTLSHHRSASSFTAGPPSLNSTQHSRMRSDITGFARHASAGSSSVSSAGRATISNNSPHQTIPVPFVFPDQHGTLSHHPSASSFAFSDGASSLYQTQASRLSSNIDGFARHTSVGSSSVSSASRQMAATAGRSASLGNPFPHQTATVPFAIPNQRGTLSHHPSASSVAFSDGATPSHHQQASRMSSNIENFARHAGGGQPSTVATSPTTAHPSAQIIRHTDMADDSAVAVTQEVIELPPEYTERPFLVEEPAQGVVAETASAPNQKSS